MILTKDSSTAECSLVQLCDDLIYQDFTENLSYSMSRIQFSVMKKQKSSGFYVLSLQQLKWDLLRIGCQGCSTSRQL